MHTEMNELMQRALDDELSVVERQRLQGHLHECHVCARDWGALTSVQRLLSSAPLLSPADGFAERVLNRIAVHQQQARRRPGIVQTLLFAVGALGVAAISIALSPLGDLLRPSGWASLLNALLSLVTTLPAWLGVLLAFTRVTVQLVGDGPLLLMALLALALTIFWARIVAGVPFRRPILAEGELQ